MSNAAQKNDQGKPDLSLISIELVEAVARVREFGSKKYARDNWKRGFKITRSCAAALRHIFSFLSGETLDPDSGLSHLAHAICSLEHALYDMKHHPANDDRVSEEPPKSKLPEIDYAQIYKRDADDCTLPGCTMCDLTEDDLQLPKPELPEGYKCTCEICIPKEEQLHFRALGCNCTLCIPDAKTKVPKL